MKDFILANIVADAVEQSMQSCQQTIINGLADGLSDGDHVDPISVQLIVKSMRLTAQMTVQVTMRLLETWGCIELPPNDASFISEIDKG